MHCNDDHTITTDYIQHDEKVLGGIGTILFKYMQHHGDKTAQIDVSTGETDTFDSLLQKCIKLAVVLQNTGIKQGDVITYYSGVHKNSLVPIVASFFIGAVPSFLDDLLPLTEITHLLKQTAPRSVITDTKYLQKVKDIVNDCGINTEIFEFTENVFRQDGDNSFKPVYINDLNQLATICFSSGSSGQPKGICLNHYRFLITGLLEDKRLWKARQDMVVYSTDSFYWTPELLKLVSSVRQGACRLVNSEEFDPKSIWHFLEKYKATVAFLIPFHIIQMCQVGKPENIRLDSLTTIYYVGCLLPKQYKVSLQEMLPGTDIFSYYGQTEVGLMLTFSKCDLHKEYNGIKVDCTGVPLVGSGTSYKVVDLKTGKILGPNREGELRIKCKRVMLGYYNLDSSECFDEEGWLKTGDVTYYDEDYCFYIVGRIKEVIIYQGWHIYPAYLEAQLQTHPSVKRAVVIGLPHHLDGERPLGVVIVDEGMNVSANDIEVYMEKVNPNRPITVKIVGRIKTTVTGKVKREELKRMVLSNEI